MPIVKVSEATRLQINWLVAKCEGKGLVYFNNWFRQNGFDKGFPEAQIDQHLHWQTNFKDRWVVLEDFTHQPQHGEAQILKRACNIDNYSTDWSQGGLIIEREFIDIRHFRGGTMYWEAWTPAPERRDGEVSEYGPTPLIAAMRCLVTSKLGDTVEIPEELCQS